MTKEELAGELNGRPMGEEITLKEEKWAKELGLVIVFGESDDLLEFRGAINDEVGAYNGTTAPITAKGVLTNDCENDECPYFEKLLKGNPFAVKAEWDKDGYSWFISSNLPFASFDIFEGKEKFCRGIVFKLPQNEGGKS